MSLNKKIVTVFAILAAAFTLPIMFGDSIHAYTTAQVNSNILGGTSWAAANDQSYRNRLNAGITNVNGMRNELNSPGGVGGAYFNRFWLSASGTPTNVNNIKVSPGSDTVNLQINRAMLVSGGLVEPNYGGGGGIARIKNDNSRWATNTNANDKRPIPESAGGPQRVSMTKNYWKISSIKSSSPKGSFTSSPVGRSISNSSSSSRYWIGSPLKFTYKQNGGFKNGDVITITVCSKALVSWRNGQLVSDMANGNAPLGYPGNQTDQTMSALADKTPHTDCSNASIRIEVPENWTINAQSYITKSNNQNKVNDISNQKKITAKVGETLLFKHDMRALNDNMVRNVSWKIRSSGSSQSDWNKIVQSGSARGSNSQLFMMSGWLNSFPSSVVSGRSGNYMAYTVKPSDAGKTICQQIDWNPLSARNSSTGYSNKVCAYITYDYELTPTVPIDSSCTSSCDKEVEPGTPDIKVPPAVVYPPKNPIKDTKWKFTSFVVRPNQTVPGASDPNKNGFKGDNTDPCSASIYNQGSRVYQLSEEDQVKKIKRCTIEQEGELKAGDFSGSGKLGVLLNDQIQKFSVPEEAEVGMKYCFALSVSPYKMDGDWSESEQNNFSQWSHGVPGCIVVVKKPKAQVLGGGLSANEGFEGLTSSRSGRLYGSWVEYEGMTTSGLNKDIATNSVFAAPDKTIGFNGTGSSTPQRTVQNRLTLANTNSAGNIGQSNTAIYGQYANNYNDALFEKMKAKYAGATSNLTTNNITGLISGDKIYKPNYDTNIGSLEIAKDSTVVIYAPDKTVNITSDIKYAQGSYALNELPQLIIIAKKIAISGEVRQIDSWLLSQDEINTCARESGQSITVGSLHNGVCANTLTVNGPVAVKAGGNSLKLWRTAGSTGTGDGIGSPAEVFNLRPDTYLWINSATEIDGKIVTTYTKELPPRF